MKKILIVATVYSHIGQFHQPLINMLKENDFEVHICGFNDLGLKNGLTIKNVDKMINLPFSRSPFSLNNIKCYKELKKITNEEKYDVVHCNTPVGGVIGRLASKQQRKYGTKVFYTAHGFHFYKGASKKNWLLYYNVEKWLSKYTDILITINKEDYNIANKKFGKRCNDIRYVHGVGIDYKKFSLEMNDSQKHNLRKSLNLNDDDFVLCYVAEQIKRKNQIMAIKAMDKLVKYNDKYKLLLVGNGALEQYYKQIVNNYKLENNVFFLGYRRDIPKLMKITDIYISTSLQEGLPVNIMEALCSKLPIVASKCRGNEDLIVNERNGYLVNLNDYEDMSKKIMHLYSNVNKRKDFSNNSTNYIKPYLIDNVIEEMKKVYDLLE